MSNAACITVAPNGARVQKVDHAALPISVQELADTARECYEAGAGTIHLHVRDITGAHSLDCELYRSAIAAVERAAPDMAIQITTESAGRYSVAEQLKLLQDLQPTAASISIREIARAPQLATEVYQTAQRHGTKVQHILYGTSCMDQLAQWLNAGVVLSSMRDAIIVLGQYTPPRAGSPSELDALLKYAKPLQLNISVCAFGADEQACLTEAFLRGCDVRIGFENNLQAPDGTMWESNAQAVSSLKALLDAHQNDHQIERAS